MAEFKSGLPDILSTYDDNDILITTKWVCFLRLCQTRHSVLNLKNVKGKGMAKERLTVILCYSLRGEKLKPFQNCFSSRKYTSNPSGSRHFLAQFVQKMWILFTIATQTMMTFLKRYLPNEQRRFKNVK